MNGVAITCPICQSSASGSDNTDSVYKVECQTCGTYYIEPSLGVWLRYDDHPDWELTPVQRAVLAREKYLYEQSPASKSDQGYHYPYKIDDNILSRIRDQGRLPSRSEQVANLIRFVGDEVSRTGENIELPENVHIIVGAVNHRSLYQLVNELVKRDLITSDRRSLESPMGVVNLTLEGWERYEAEQHGRFQGNYGFLAMQFDVELDAFVRDVVKPAAKEATGHELVDLRDVSKAGLIDNLMVTTIRDAKFVIADLTHDNRGAYWEAGYAEGLGKPVVYICSKKKFNDGQGTHFDTNHYTTVQWSMDDVASFRQELIAPLRRSLAVVTVDSIC